jgi:hypothetical protein
MRALFFGWLMFLSSLAFAQSDSLQYTQGFSFNTGIYLTYDQFRTNSPLPKSALVYEGDTSKLDFLRQLLTKDSFQWRDTAGVLHTTKMITTWGYCENKTVYIRYNYSFNRVMVIGTICHFTAYVTNYMYTGPGSAPTSQYGTPVETMQQYVLDTKTGSIYDFNPQTISYILQRDPVLSAEYSALKKRQKKDQAFIYLRKYNEKHPLYFPK